MDACNFYGYRDSDKRFEPACTETQENAITTDEVNADLIYVNISITLKEPILYVIGLLLV